MSKEDNLRRIFEKAGLGSEFGGLRDGATHNSAGVRVRVCEHHRDIPPKGWCAYCDKPNETPKPAKVTFKARNEKYVAVGMSRIDLYEVSEGWFFVGEICSNTKPIARIYFWASDDTPVHPAR